MHYIRKYASATIAAGGVGKSSLITVEGLEMVTGQGLIIPHSGDKLRVWIWNGEDPREEVERRILAACVRYKISPEEIGDRLFVESGRDMPIVLATEARGGLVIATPIVEALKAEILERQIDVIMVDPFVRCHRVSENDNNKINAVMEAWAEVADRANCSIALALHAKKLGGLEADEEAAGRLGHHRRHTRGPSS